jgi:hypothetical protein
MYILKDLDESAVACLSFLEDVIAASSSSSSSSSLSNLTAAAFRFLSLWLSENPGSTTLQIQKSLLCDNSLQVLMLSAALFLFFLSCSRWQLAAPLPRCSSMHASMFAPARLMQLRPRLPRALLLLLLLPLLLPLRFRCSAPRLQAPSLQLY